MVEGTRPSADPLPFTLLLLEALTDAYNPVSDYRTRLVSAKECMQEMRHDLDHALAQTSKVEEHEGKKARRSLDPNASFAAAHTRLEMALAGCALDRWPLECTQGAPSEVKLELDPGLLAALREVGRVVREEPPQVVDPMQQAVSSGSIWGSSILEEEEDRFELRDESLLEQQEKTTRSVQAALSRSMKLTS